MKFFKVLLSELGFDPFEFKINVYLVFYMVVHAALIVHVFRSLGFLIVDL